jgi:hypothetical protein
MDMRGVVPPADPISAPGKPVSVATSVQMTSVVGSSDRLNPVKPQAPAAPPKGAAVLTIRRNGAAADQFHCEGSAVLGRFDPETGPVDIDLGKLPEAGKISRRHAELRKDEASGRWAIRDLGAGNGTFRKPKGEAKFHQIAKDQEEPLSDGDEIGLGTARFEFRTA